MTVSIAAGGGIHNLWPLISCSLNQSPGSSLTNSSDSHLVSVVNTNCPLSPALSSPFSLGAHQDSPSSSFHHKSIHSLTLPCDLRSASSFRGKYFQGLSPLMMPSTKSCLDKPSPPTSFILVPEMCITCKMQPVSLSTLLSLKMMPVNLGDSL